MSGSAPDSPVPDRRLLAVLGGVAWIALTTALFGFLSLLLDIDVIREAAAGPLVGPVMVLAGAVALGILLVRAPADARRWAWTAVSAIALVWIALLLVGGAGYAIATADPVQLLFFPARYVVSPFVVGAALLAAPVALGVLVSADRSRRGGRPRWPWEDRDEP